MFWIEGVLVSMTGCGEEKFQFLRLAFGGGVGGEKASGDRKRSETDFTLKFSLWGIVF